jgi:hypothetical protein
VGQQQQAQHQPRAPSLRVGGNWFGQHGKRDLVELSEGTSFSIKTPFISLLLSFVSVFYIFIV